MFDIKENLKKLPDSPGVYLHKDGLGQVIYVGKAISLKNRVRQYFQNSASHSPKVRAMVSHIAEFEYITCQTEMEALILECNLIKKYAPKYNVLLRDDKTYPYIKVTLSEEFPRIVKTRIIARDGDKYFGPYSDAGAVNQIIELLNQVYTLKRCSARSFPEGSRPCLNYHIGQCRGICTGQVDRKAYMDSIDAAIDFLGGKQKRLIDHLTAKMMQYSDSLQYEEAAVYRDYINAAKSIGSVQRVSLVSGKDLDIVLPVGAGNTQSVVLFTVRDGKLSGRETFAMQAAADDDYDSLIGEFIKQYYSQWASLPPEILVPKPLSEGELIESFLEAQEEGRKVRIFTPQRGDKKALLDLALRDAGEMTKNLEDKLKAGEERNRALLDELADVLGIRKESYRIESYDISNTNGVDTVGAMVVFQNLKPVRRDYRRFKIKTVTGPDDYGSLREMLMRRMRRYLAGDPGFKTLPDVILMDGGQGQVTVAENVLEELGISVPVLGMAKDDSHRTRALVNGRGDEILLVNRPLLFKYCGTIQEEVHRFAIEYHRNLHNRNSITSVLDNIKGIGPVKRNALLSHFDSVEDIKKASVEKLMEVPGITEQNAYTILEYFS